MSKDQIMNSITPKDALKLIEKHKDDPNFEILDIRSDREYSLGHIPGAKSLHYEGHEFQRKVENLDKEKEYVIYCKSGVRGGYFLNQMEKSGFNKAHNIQGGFMGWQVSRLPLTKD
ncbi:MAG: rhodanese-like domain-containing protein [Methanobacterium sp.]